MPPGLAAAADRFLADLGYVLYLADGLDEADLGRKPPHGEWDVRQLLAHLASVTGGQAAGLERLSTGGPLMTGDFDSKPFSREAAAAAHSLTLPEIDASLRAARARMLIAIAALPAALEAERVNGWTLLEVVTAWSLHPLHHALDLAEALPALASDQMIAGWIAAADLEADPPLRARQRAILDAASRAQRRKRKHTPA